MIVLVGESASGKSTLENILAERHGYKKVISYTTREPRVGETDGKDYHFISKNEFDEKLKSGFFAETGEYNGWSYGSAKENYTKESVVVLTPHGMRQIKRTLNGLYACYVYINVSREKRLIRNLERGDNIEEAYRRSLSDVGQFDGIEDEVNVVVNGECDSPFDIAKKINAVHNLLMVNEMMENTNKKKVVLCDIDDTVNNLIEELMKHYKSTHPNENVGFEDIKSWDINKYLEHNIFEICNNELLKDLKWQPDSKEVINKLMGKYDFYFVTATSLDHIATKREWLKSSFPQLTDENIIVCKNKKLLKGDYIIDDCLDNFDWNNNETVSIIFDKPWNRKLSVHQKEDEKHIRVKSWKEILTILIGENE